MQKMICKRLYDTDTAALIKKSVGGVFGADDGYEESLYRTEDGKYFLYTNGGPASKYKKEDIKRLSKEAADKFISEN